MEIKLNDVGKRFGYNWIYRHLNLFLKSGDIYAIRGPNGSGKSTLLKLISKYTSPSEGMIQYTFPGNMDITEDRYHQHISYSAPYMSVIEDMTLTELFTFHSTFRDMQVSLNEWIHLLQLTNARDKQIKHFSSGMKQRTNLALAICTQSQVYFIDEPSTNLDLQGRMWFKGLLEAYGQGKLIIIASNEESDFELCNKHLDVDDIRYR